MIKARHGTQQTQKCTPESSDLSVGFSSRQNDQNASFSVRSRLHLIPNASSLSSFWLLYFILLTALLVQVNMLITFQFTRSDLKWMISASRFKRIHIQLKKAAENGQRSPPGSLTHSAIITKTSACVISLYYYSYSPIKHQALFSVTNMRDTLCKEAEWLKYEYYPCYE